MLRIENVTDEDIIKYRDIFDKADFLGMTIEEAVKLVDDYSEKLLFVCGHIWILFGYDEKNRLEYQTFVVNEGKVVSFTNDDYQVNYGDNMIYLIYEDGKHESLQFFKNYDNPDFEVSSNGIVSFMQYNPKLDKRCVIKYEHFAYGDCSRIYDVRLEIPYEVTVENGVRKRDKGLKFLGVKNSYYRLDFDVWNNRWQYDLATMGEYGIGAVLANDTISLHMGEKSFSRYYRELFSIGDYFTLTGFPFFRQYTLDDMAEYVEHNGFDSKISQKLIDLYNNQNKYIEYLQNIVLSYNCRMESFYIDNMTL